MVIGWEMRRIAAFIVIVLVAVFGFGGTSANAKGPFGSIKIGLWTGGAYTDEKTNAFSHCAAVAPYLNGISLFISENANDQWTMAFASPTFHLTVGETFPIDLTLDGQKQLRLFGNAATAELVVAPLPSVALVRKSHLMVAQAREVTYQFELTSIEKVVSTVANCVSKTKTAGIAGAGDFSVMTPKPVVQTTTPAPSPAQAKTAKTVGRTGTGFVVSATGHIITNNHVIDGCVGDIHGNLTGEASSVLRVVSTDEINDLALLQVPKTFNDVAVIRATAIHSGDAIIAIGFPFHGLLTSDFTVTAGIVSSLSGLLNDTRYLQISAGVQSGNSGGPLFDTSGNVVGVVSSKLNAIKVAKATGDLPQNINFAIKTGTMRDFLDNSVVPYRTAEPKTELKTADIATQARAYTMLISCTAKEEE
jgi:S1-C subfamily serine protease